jgi:hypothetical protein
MSEQFIAIAIAVRPAQPYDVAQRRVCPMLRKLSYLAVTVMTLLLARSAAADNLTSGTAYSIKPQAVPATGWVTTGTPARWYRFSAVAGRSYCADTQGGINFDTTSTQFVDTTLDVYRSDGTTSLGSIDDDGQEPFGFFLSRVCWVAPASETNYIKVGLEPDDTSLNYALKLTETTLFSNWFYTGADYSAYTIIRNTTSTTLSYTINWRNGSGAVVGTTSGTLAGNASTFIDARSIGSIGAGKNGTVEIVHNSSPGAIMATSTVLSATTGLSFDTFFTQRPNW